MRRAESKWALCDPVLILADTLPVNISIRRVQRCVRQVSSQLQSFSPENILTPIASLMLTRCPSRFPQFQFLEVTYNQCRCTCCRALPRASITRSPVPAPSILYRLCLQDHDRLRKWVGLVRLYMAWVVHDWGQPKPAIETNLIQNF